LAKVQGLVMPLLLVHASGTTLKSIGLVVIVAGVALSLLAYRLLNRFDAGSHDFHGNSMRDPTGFRYAGAMVLLCLGLFFAMIIGPTIILVGVLR
jgi:hypothetical protein